MLQRGVHLRPRIRDQPMSLRQRGGKIGAILRVQQIVDSIDGHFKLSRTRVQCLKEFLRGRREIVDLLGQRIEIEIRIGRKQ